MRFLRNAALGLAASVTSVVVACSSSPSSGGSEPTAATSGPLRGTYSADSDDGDSPFASITFLEDNRYESLDRFCTPDTQNCEHTGTYSIDGSELTLSPDGSATSVHVPLDAAQTTDGIVVITTGEDSGTIPGVPPSADAGDAGDAGTATTTTTTTTTTTVAADAGVLVDNGSGLVMNGTVVVSFPVSGTPMTQSPAASTTPVTAPTTAPSSGSPLVSGSPSSPTTTPSSGTSSSPSSADGQGSAGGTQSTPSTGNNVVTAGAVASALTWVTAKVPYCGGINNGPDAICGGTCHRTGAANNPQWNAYRSDCSGLVSFAWGLPAPGLVCQGMAPMSTAKSSVIPGNTLQPGDALNSGHHVVLFQQWVDQKAGTATIIEESDCHLVALTKNVTLKVSATPNVQMGSSTYYAIRVKGGSLVNSGK